jgi:hypothetical protein
VLTFVQSHAKTPPSSVLEGLDNRFPGFAYTPERHHYHHL